MTGPGVAMTAPGAMALAWESARVARTWAPAPGLGRGPEIRALGPEMATGDDPRDAGRIVASPT